MCHVSTPFKQPCAQNTLLMLSTTISILTILCPQATVMFPRCFRSNRLSRPLTPYFPFLEKTHPSVWNSSSTIYPNLLHNPANIHTTLLQPFIPEPIDHHNRLTRVARQKTWQPCSPCSKPAKHRNKGLHHLQYPHPRKQTVHRACIEVF